MKWSEINHLYHGFTCTIMMTTPEEPLVVLRRTGVIICGHPNNVAYMTNVMRSRYMKPNDNVTVVVHSPAIGSDNW